MQLCACLFLGFAVSMRWVDVLRGAFVKSLRVGERKWKT